MATRILIGGLLAGIVMFFWSSVAHEVLPFGEMGLKAIPNEDEALTNLKTNITESGLYFFPMQDMIRAKALPEEQRKAAEEEWMKKYQTGPSGLMVFHPEGGNIVEGKTLAIEFISDVLAGCILALIFWAAAQKVSSFGGRVALSAAIGFLPWLVVDLSYWNWYGFPTEYFLAQAADYVVGTVLAGILLGWWLQRPLGIKKLPHHLFLRNATH